MNETQKEVMKQKQSAKEEVLHCLKNMKKILDSKKALDDDKLMVTVGQVCFVCEQMIKIMVPDIEGAQEIVGGE